MGLIDLPVELFYDILNSVDSQHLQHTVLNLHRAIPTKGIPVSHFIFRYVRLFTPRAIVKFLLDVKGNPDHAAKVQELSIEACDADPKVITDLLALIPEHFTVSALSLYIGPKNFAPSQLHALLSRPIIGLKRLAIRFNPYLETANYHSFHAGTYFDSSLVALAGWPAGSIPTLSIVQDPDKFHQSFAQPLVFFHLDSITTLSTSTATRTLTSLRLKIPSRDVTRYLCTGPRSFPSIHHLDLSTCDIRLSHLEPIFSQFVRLQHIILDECNLFRGMEIGPGAWRTLGEKCALYGIKRATDKQTELSQANALAPPVSSVASKRRGRKGVATATVTLRDFRPTSAKNATRDFRVIPPPPTLVSISTSVHATMDIVVAQQEFEKGWTLGLRQLNAVRRKLHNFWRRGHRILEFFDELDGVEEDSRGGLVEVEPGDDEAFIHLSDTDVEGVEYCPMPVFCLAHDQSRREHAPNCGHSYNWKVWKDVLDE